MRSFPNSQIKHSIDFMDKVRNLPTHGKKLVESFFINFPFDDVLEFLERKLKDDSYSGQSPYRFVYVSLIMSLFLSANF